MDPVEVEIARAERLFTREGWVNVVVELVKGEDSLTVWFSHDETKAFDDWVTAFQQLGRTVTVRDAVWAFLVAHGSGSKSLIAGFLRASDFKDVEARTVGEVLSKEQREGRISKDTVMTKTVFNGVPHKVRYKSILGESVYYLSVEQRGWARPWLEESSSPPKHWLFRDLPARGP